MFTITSTRTPQWVLDAMEERSSTDAQGQHADFEGRHMTYEKISDTEIRINEHYSHLNPNRITSFNLNEHYNPFHWCSEFEVLAELEGVTTVHIGNTQYDITF